MRRPREVSKLAEEAKAYDFTTTVSFRAWIHVAKTLLDEARIYKDEDAYEESYIMYCRYADLVLNSMPKHPDFRKYQDQFVRLRDYVAVMKKGTLVGGVLKDMEQLRSILDQQVESWKIMEQARAIREQRAKNKEQQQQQQQQKKLEPKPKSGSQAGDGTRTGTLNESAPPEDNSYMETLSALKRLKTPGLAPTTNLSDQKTVNWSYPTVPKASTNSEPSSHVLSPYAPLAPQPPPKEALLKKQSPGESPLKNESPPKASPTTKDSQIEHKIRAYSEDGSPLRTLFFPSQLRLEFLKIAEPNTRANLETCGMLCGKLNRKAFFITHLVIPQQESTSDTCTTTNEEDLFQYVDENELFILGWIHTHPSQTCFLSSIDLHTQTSYQIMLPEAVAMVCAPQHEPSWGVFRLTDPPGIPTLKKCTNTATFHPHPEPNLYQTAHEPGHVVMKNLKFTMHDLRQ